MTAGSDDMTTGTDATPWWDDEEETPLPSSASGDVSIRPVGASDPEEAPAEDQPNAAAPSDDGGAALPPGQTADNHDDAPAMPAPDMAPDTAPKNAGVKNGDADPDADSDEDDRPMTLLGHLNELRRRLMRVVIVVVLGFVACYGVAEPLYEWLSAPLMAEMPANGTLMFDAPQGMFFVYLKVALVASLFLTSPLSFYQLWAFIAPGLYQEEKRAVLPLSLLSAVFFLAGAAFCYFLVFPVAMRFFMSFATDAIVPMISVQQYLSFSLKLLIAFGLVFEMPLFAHFLAKMGLVTPERMRRYRKYAVLVIFVVAAILTPPDVFSQIMMAGPMLLLYEISVLVAARARRSREKRLAKAKRKRKTSPSGHDAASSADDAADAAANAPRGTEEADAHAADGENAHGQP